MLFQLDWRFWLPTLLIFVLIRLRTPLGRTTWFGLLNLFPLGLLLGPRGVVAVTFFSLALWASLRLAVMQERRWPLVPYATLIAVVLVILCLQKGSFEVMPSGGSQMLITALATLQVISFSYVALRAWDAIESVRDGQRLLNPLALSGYLAPFFMMPAGPINVYSDHVAMDERSIRDLTPRGYFDGVETVIRGLFIKFCLADGLRMLLIGVNGEWDTSNLIASSGVFLYIFLDFWGYSVVALGIGRLLDVPTPVNFDRPWMSKTLTEFWTRWHISLGDFVKRRVYFPLQIAMMRRTDKVHIINVLSLVAAFSFVGMWHRFTIPFFAWGFFFGVALAAEKLVADRYAAALGERPAVRWILSYCGPIYTIFVVVLMLHMTAMSQMVGGK